MEHEQKHSTGFLAGVAVVMLVALASVVGLIVWMAGPEILGPGQVESIKNAEPTSWKDYLFIACWAMATATAAVAFVAWRNNKYGSAETT